MTKLPLAFLLLVAVTGACSDPAAPVDRCTQQFNLFTVTVLDTAGEPAANVEIMVRRVEDGAVLVNDFVLPTPGVYVILTDNNLDDVSESGTAVVVIGTLGDAGFTEAYVFNRDSCHVWKLSGPDTVQLVRP